MITTRFLYHVCHKLRSNWSPALILLVLPSIREKWNNSGDPLGAGNSAGVNHDAKFHESGVNGATSSVDDVYVVLPNRLCNGDICLPNAAASHLCFRKGQANAEA